MEKIKLTTTRQEIVNKMSFKSIEDILRYYPYRYDIYKDEALSMSLHNQKVCVEGFIISKIKVEHFNNRVKTSFVIKTKTNEVKLTMFNKFANKYIKDNSSIVALGKYNAFYNEISVSSFFVGTLNGKEKITPVYSLPTDIKEYTYGMFVKYAYKFAIENSLIKEYLPSFLKEKYKLVSLKDALLFIHNPNDESELAQAKRYLKYEELLNFTIIGALKRKYNDSFIKKHAKIINYFKVKEFIYSLPFKLSKDQISVVAEIFKDMENKRGMYRLLQGDVGSGKTIVALIALVANYTASYQGVIMAPTDILARQHYESFIAFLKNSGIKIALLVSNMPANEKKEVINKLKNNEIDIVVGTHSLIQDDVSFNNLGLAIIDEQHRFGVKQREALKNKGESLDVLYMSATPIPRTLASTIYMDMDVSTIKSYPYSNRKIISKYIDDDSINSEKEFVLNYLKSKQKIYVVCPCIEESNLEIFNVQEIFLKWQKMFKGIKIGMIHGKLSSDEKNKIMDEFKNSDMQVLISTTIIEVGISIKNANMMIIYNAERFGLAQLHQLRGRIARDGSTGYCYFLSSSMDIDVSERLKFISSTNDGFKISEYDLKRRGAGDMLGVAQSGKSPFTIANLIDDYNILKVASKDALYILNNEDDFKDYISHVSDIINKSVDFVD
ncbi:MAG: ATP-dependent DNA helicase RecG [Candidatus Caccosoma sp.]|nr:ATP-dependent DNA helicase RecG [Candidatus Caccosoma sp.]